MNKIYVGIYLCLCCLLCIGAEPLSSEERRIKELLRKEADIELKIANCEPNKRITTLMIEIDEIAQALMAKPDDDKAIELSRYCLEILAALRERRVYAYMLWAERMLELSSSGRYENLSALNQRTLMAMYCKLSEIDISLIRENMLSREIMSRLAEIYNLLEPQNKRIVRVHAIKLQRDQLSVIKDIPLRKTLDDF